MSGKIYEHFVVVNNKKYKYILKPIKGGKLTYFQCDGAKIAQEFLGEDITSLLLDLPELIISEIEYKKSQDNVIRFRVSKEDKKKIIKNAHKKGYKNVSSYLRDLALSK